MVLLEYKNSISMFQIWFLEDDNNKEKSFYLHNSQKVNMEKLQPFICGKNQRIIYAKPILLITITFSSS